MTTPDEIPDFVRSSVNLASAGLGAKALFATDDFFAPVSRMLQDADPVFQAELYDEHGKYMDGWESRRKREVGHDHAVVRLATPGSVRGFDVDTSFFTGNYPPAVRIEAANVKGDPGEGTGWTEVVPVTQIGPSAHHYLPSRSESVFSHVRLHIYPDGGIARFRVFGIPHIDEIAMQGKLLDLASGLNGGRIVAYSDAHYGAFHRVLSPGRGLNMGDGWETRRRRTPGNDWIIVALGARGTVESIEVDTAHYKGNFPDSCSVLGGSLPRGADSLAGVAAATSMFWPELLPPQKLTADSIHSFTAVNAVGPVTHVRLNIFPDGGISRLRVFGKLVVD